MYATTAFPLFLKSEMAWRSSSICARPPWSPSGRRNMYWTEGSAAAASMLLTASQSPVGVVSSPCRRDIGFASCVCSVNEILLRFMSSTPERGRTGVLLPNEARAPTKPKNRNEPMIPIMKRPQITANVILIKSFMLSKYFVCKCSVSWRRVQGLHWPPPLYKGKK